MLDRAEEWEKQKNKPSLRLRITLLPLMICLIAVTLFTALESGLIYNALLTEQKRDADALVDSVMMRLGEEMETGTGEFPFAANTMDKVRVILAPLEREGYDWMILGKDWSLLESSSRQLVESIEKHKGYSVFIDKRIEIGGVFYYTGEPFKWTNYSCYALIPLAQLKAKVWMTISTLMYILLYILFFVAVAIIAIIWNVTAPFHTMITTITEVGEGKLYKQMPSLHFRELDEVQLAFNDAMSKVRLLIKEKYENELLISQLQFRQLQSQMNPHFLFNVLSTISFKALDAGEQEIYEMMTASVALLQDSLRVEDTDHTITLGEELETVRFFLYLEEKRFPEGFYYSVDGVTEKLNQALIPRFCVEPIVENAAVHGIEPKGGEGRILIRVSEEEGDLLVRIEDDGVGFDDSGNKGSRHLGIGLKNIRQLILNIYGEPYGIHVDSQKGKGTVVTLRIPLHFREKE